MNGYNFTDRVRKVLQMSREEAARLGQRYVGTEHILLSMIGEGEGVGTAVLIALDIDLKAIKRTIEETVDAQPGRRENAVRPAGRDLSYTSRAKKVLEMAMSEARDLSCRYIDTGILLLGLLREEKGIAAQVLTAAGVTLDRARAETLKLAGSEPLPKTESPGGRSGGYNFTDRVRTILHLAREEAARLGHEYVGTEHILLGLVREGEGVAAAVLTNLNVDVEELEQMIEQRVTKGGAARVVGPDLPYTRGAKKVLELAMAETRELDHSYVGSEHLLLGLLREGAGVAAEVLTDLGVTLEEARAETLRLLGTEMPSGPPRRRPAETPGRTRLFSTELLGVPGPDGSLLDNSAMKATGLLTPRCGPP